MNVNELYNNGVAAFEADRYSDAIPYFQQAAELGSADAAAYLPLCYFSLAGDVSAEASKNPNDTERLVRGQQYAVKMADSAIRSALNFLRNYPQDRANGNVAALMITRSFSLQYALVATGLTTAYRLTTTTRTIERTNWGDVTLWEEIVGEETESYVSLASFDMRDYHIFGDDERTKKIEQNKELILQNAVQVASILGCMGREYDALLVRAAVACEMADCENGVRSMLLAADWFLCRAMEVGTAMLKVGDDSSAYDAWLDMNEICFNEYKEYEAKYGAVIRQMKRDKMRPYLNRFYDNPALVPKVEDCALYTAMQEATKDLNKRGAVKGDGFAAFLTTFAQATTQRVIPIVVFPGVFSLLFGGMLRPETGVNALSIIWLILTLGLTFIRSIKDASVTGGRSEFLTFMGIRFGIAIAFSLNFWLGLVPFIILKVLSKRYK